MADNSAKVVKMARILAIVHIIVGLLLFCFGIADRVERRFMPSWWGGSDGKSICFGIWTGVWMCITGGLGIPGTRKEQSTSRNPFAGVFMGFSITSAVLGGVIIIFYSLAIAEMREQWYEFERWYEFSSHGDDFTARERHIYTKEMALSSIILILGIVEFAIGIWAAVCLCLMKPCTCCNSNSPQQRQVMYTASAGNVMTQASGGVPVAISTQATGGTVAVQGDQPQFIQVASAGAKTTGYQPQLIQVASAGAKATGYQPQQVEIPPSYEQGQLMTQ